MKFTSFNIAVNNILARMRPINETKSDTKNYASCKFNAAKQKAAKKYIYQFANTIFGRG